MYVIRKAEPEDALGIMIVNVYTWKTAYAGLMADSVLDARIAGLKESAQKCRSDIEQGRHFLVASVENTVVGFCIYGGSRNGDYKDSGEIIALYVLRGFQGMGIGKALFASAVKELLAQKYDSVIINCLRGNPSLGFYQHLGGTVAGQRRDEITKGKITEDIVFFEDLRKISPEISTS